VGSRRAPRQRRDRHAPGDLVTGDADGLYHFFGRRGLPGKSKGYHIELGEVERALAAHPEVEERVVGIAKIAVNAGPSGSFARTASGKLSRVPAACQEEPPAPDPDDQQAGHSARQTRQGS
jgi:hypothetical protein